MSKKKYKKGIKSIKKEIELHKNVKNRRFLSSDMRELASMLSLAHLSGNRFAIYRHIKLEKALEEGNIELAAYYEKEIKRLEEQLMEKQKKLLPRSKRLKMRE